MDVNNRIIPTVKNIEEFGKKVIFSKLKFKKNKYTDLLKKWTSIKESSNGIEINIEFVNEGYIKKIKEEFNISKDIVIEEAYYIEWRQESINIKVTSNRGVINSIATIAQFLNNEKGIKECNIFDYPDLKIRGIHLDLKFHNFTMEYIKGIVRRLAYYKYNTILLEYEDKFPLKNHPDISSIIAFTESEIKDIIKYATNFGIDIIPLQQSLGHSEYILRLEKYIDLRENYLSNRQFCPLKKEAFEFITSIFDEYIEKHPSKYFHIGCDEAWYLGFCDRCKKYVAKYSREKLFVNYINKLIKYLNSKGKVAILWGDMIEKRKRNFNLLKGKYIFTYWDYVSTDKFPYVKNYDFNKTISVSAIRMMADGFVFPDYDFHIKNIYGFIKESVKNKYLGHIVSGWAISRVPFESTIMGIIGGAEFSWSSETNISLFQKKFLSQYLGSKDDKLIPLINEINNNIKYEVEGIVNDLKKEKESINKIFDNIKTLKSIKTHKEFGKFIEAGINFKLYKYSKLRIKKFINEFNNGKLASKDLYRILKEELESMKNRLNIVLKIYKKYYAPVLRGFGFLNEKKVIFNKELENIILLEESIEYIKKNKLKFIAAEKVYILRDYFIDLKGRKGEEHGGYKRGMDSWFNYSL